MNRKSIPFSILILFVFLHGNGQNIRDRVQQRQADKQILGEENSKPPDYKDLFYWAAHPGKKDPADTIAGFLSSAKNEELADVFFLHPTTYTKKMRNSMWNADLHDKSVNKDTDEKPILFQASVFNNCCRVYAPRYRQAHLKAFFSPASEASQQAFDLAYEDLKKAFQYYLDHDNKGRPIVIAAHSQGAMHAIRLLKEFFDEKPLRKKLVCAYIVGWQIKPNEFKSIPLGETAGATGCYLGWRSYKKDQTDFIIDIERGGSVCVNPISWTTSSQETSLTQHKGAVGKNLSKLFSNTITTSISVDHHILWVDAPARLSEPYVKIKNYHIADYNLFYLDIRENVLLRVKTFLNKK